jgi:acyl carrier protein
MPWPLSPLSKETSRVFPSLGALRSQAVDLAGLDRVFDLAVVDLQMQELRELPGFLNRLGRQVFVADRDARHGLPHPILGMLLPFAFLCFDVSLPVLGPQGKIAVHIFVVGRDGVQGISHEVEILDSFGFVELVVGVSDDLNLEIDLADLGDEPLATFGEVVTAFLRATSVTTGSCR